MRALTVLIVLLVYPLVSAAALAQTQTGASPPPQGSIESALAIEDPNARIAALQKFLKSNIIPEQTQIAREALVVSYAQLGETELGENNIERAGEEFRRAVAGLPEKITGRFFEETVIRIPLAVSIRGYRNEAIALARLLEKRFAKEASHLARIGEFYLTIEAPSDAIRTLEAASTLTEEEATLHRALGAAYRMGLRLDDAVAEYQQAVHFDPKDKRAYYEMANLYRAHGASADAVKLYQRQIEIDPKHTPSYKGLALAYLSMGKEDDAAAALNQARDIRGAAEEITGDIYLQTQLAFHYLGQRKLKQARQAAEMALYVEPRYAWARIAAAEIEMAEGKYFDAERNLLAAKAYASFPTLFFTLGKLYLSVEDFDGAQEQFSQAFAYSPQKQFSTRLGGTLDVQADNLKELLSREHQAAIFLDQPPTSDEQFKIAESLVKFNTRLRMLKAPPPVNRPVRGGSKSGPPESNSNAPSNNSDAWRRQMEELDQAAMSFVEAENVRRSYRMLFIAQRLSNAGVATGLAIELADQALGLAEVATEFEGSLREYPNYDRNGRLAIFRGRALDAKGWALFKINKPEEAIAALNEAVRAYGTLPESKGAIRHLAAAKETVGELNAALDLYIAAYEPAANSNLDVNRAVIEGLYRKVNGSLQGLEKRIGPSTIASNTNFSKSNLKTPETKPVRSSGKKEGRTKSSIPSLPPPDVFNKEIVSPSSAPAVPVETEPRVSAAPAEPKSFNTPAQTAASTPLITEPAPIVKKPIELPAIIRATDRSTTVVPLIDLKAFDSAFERFPARTIVERDADSPPPPPAPQVHTRKRRVTVPDDQPPI